MINSIFFTFSSWKKTLCFLQGQYIYSCYNFYFYYFFISLILHQLLVWLVILILHHFYFLKNDLPLFSNLIHIFKLYFNLIHTIHLSLHLLPNIHLSLYKTLFFFIIIIIHTQYIPLIETEQVWRGKKDDSPYP